MEVIKIYHSFRRNAFVFFGSAALTYLMGISLLMENVLLAGWFCTILFGGSCLFLLFCFLRERLTGEAYLVITDKSLRINTFKGIDVPFEDVASFESDGKNIWITSKNGKHVCDCFMARGLTKKPKDICELLNGRLKGEH